MAEMDGDGRMYPRTGERWRPEGWVFSQPIAQVDRAYKKGEVVSARLLTPSEKALFEAGADAMLEALGEGHYLSINPDKEGS